MAENYENFNELKSTLSEKYSSLKLNTGVTEATSLDSASRYFIDLFENIKKSKETSETLFNGLLKKLVNLIGSLLSFTYADIYLRRVKIKVEPFLNIINVLEVISPSGNFKKAITEINTVILSKKQSDGTIPSDYITDLDELFETLNSNLIEIRKKISFDYEEDNFLNLDSSKYKAFYSLYKTKEAICLYNATYDKKDEFSSTRSNEDFNEMKYTYIQNSLGEASLYLADTYDCLLNLGKSYSESIINHIKSFLYIEKLREGDDPYYFPDFIQEIKDLIDVYLTNMEELSSFEFGSSSMESLKISASSNLQTILNKIDIAISEIVSSIELIRREKEKYSLIFEFEDNYGNAILNSLKVIDSIFKLEISPEEIETTELNMNKSILDIIEETDSTDFDGTYFVSINENGKNYSFGSEDEEESWYYRYLRNIDVKDQVENAVLIYISTFLSCAIYNSNDSIILLPKEVHEHEGSVGGYWSGTVSVYSKNRDRCFLIKNNITNPYGDGFITAEAKLAPGRKYKFSCQMKLPQGIGFRVGMRCHGGGNAFNDYKAGTEFTDVTTLPGHTLSEWVTFEKEFVANSNLTGALEGNECSLGSISSGYHSMEEADKHISRSFLLKNPKITPADDAFTESFKQYRESSYTKIKNYALDSIVRKRLVAGMNNSSAIIKRMNYEKMLSSKYSLDISTPVDNCTFSSEIIALFPILKALDYVKVSDLYDAQVVSLYDPDTGTTINAHSLCYKKSDINDIEKGERAKNKIKFLCFKAFLSVNDVDKKIEKACKFLDRRIFESPKTLLIAPIFYEAVNDFKKYEKNDLIPETKTTTINSTLDIGQLIEKLAPSISNDLEKKLVENINNTFYGLKEIIAEYIDYLNLTKQSIELALEDSFIYKFLNESQPTILSQKYSPYYILNQNYSVETFKDNINALVEKA